jgi:galactokinase
MIKHELATGEYNRRRAECEEGVRILQRPVPDIRALRDVSMEQLEEYKSELPPIIYRRCAHVIGENNRVLEFARALRDGNLSRVGPLMRASHSSLRDDYEVSCRELDTLVALADEAPGILGSRMTGGGFGGCTVSLVTNENVKAFVTFLSAQYQKVTSIEPEIYVTRAAEGANELSDGK